MRLFRTKYTDWSGKSRKAMRRWYVDFVDHQEIRRRIPAFTDRKRSERFARNVENLVQRTGNGQSPNDTLVRWLETLPIRLLERLRDIGLLAASYLAATKPLVLTTADDNGKDILVGGHLADFRQSLLDKGNTDEHAKLVTSRLRRVVEGCSFGAWVDVEAGKIQAFLADLRKDTDTKKGISPRTYNFYVQAMQQFCSWMVREGRASVSPVETLTPLSAAKVRADCRHGRRALTVHELCLLIETAHDGPTVLGMTGMERAMLYRLAVETGLRWSELRSLTRSNFDLDSKPPVVHLQAAYSKNSRSVAQPLPGGTADDLRSFLAHKYPGAKAFDMPGKSGDGAKMIRNDLGAASIPYVDAAGRVADFHSLRHTFITNLAASGVHPKVAQDLARHSTITLTMDHYTHTLRGQQADALAKLPDLAVSGREAAAATGTDGAEPDAKNFATNSAKSCGFRRAHTDSDGQTTGPMREEQVSENPSKYRANPTECSAKASPGRVSEWLKEPVLKTGVPKGTVGSNPTPTVTTVAGSQKPVTAAPFNLLD